MPSVAALMSAAGRLARQSAVHRRGRSLDDLNVKTGKISTRPVAMIKLSDNPPMLHPAVSSLRELTGQWWVAHTRARNEKALAWEMARRDVGYFLPMIRRTIFSGGRRRRSLVPLFPSYVFLSGDDQA